MRFVRVLDPTAAPGVLSDPDVVAVSDALFASLPTAEEGVTYEELGAGLPISIATTTPIQWAVPSTGGPWWQPNDYVVFAADPDNVVNDGYLALNIGSTSVDLCLGADELAGRFIEVYCDQTEALVLLSGGVSSGTILLRATDQGPIVGIAAKTGQTTTLFRVSTSAGNAIEVLGDRKVGFNGATPIAKPTVTGSRGANAALASLCTALANLGLITDSTS